MPVVITSHKVAGAPFKPTPNHGTSFAAGMPDTLIIHFTGGSSADSSVAWLCNPQAKASAHVVVARDGSITQLVPFDIVAWHAGESSYGGRSGFNRYSIGIEIDNPGRLARTEAGSYVASFGRSYPPEQVISAVHRNEHSPSFWLTYPEPQIAAVFDLCAALCAAYGIKQILGHEEIAPGRKIDPGPAFPLDRLRLELIERGRDAEGPSAPAVAGRTPAGAAPSAATQGVVIADWLNIRLAPRADAPLAAQPLRRGTLVEVLGQQSGWYRVGAGASGWVLGKYLKT
jgi:N-acetylmuramoyl-L-alanine amidase